ncbi:MAG TPA: DUF5615 family PIN-like protein [Patescibacteria group bacterium]|nr:DUF5615 family PIN-like protein [Patescibacteria group bacterium]
MISQIKKRSIRHSSKPKILLDENFSSRHEFRRVNQYCNIRHISRDLKISGLDDPQVYDMACKQGRMVATFNSKHFRLLVKDDTPSVIGISSKLTNDQIDKKLMSLIKNIKPVGYTGKYFFISSETNRTK